MVRPSIGGSQMFGGGAGGPALTHGRRKVEAVAAVAMLFVTHIGAANAYSEDDWRADVNYVNRAVQNYGQFERPFIGKTKAFYETTIYITRSKISYTIERSFYSDFYKQKVRSKETYKASISDLYDRVLWSIMQGDADATIPCVSGDCASYTYTDYGSDNRSGNILQIPIMLSEMPKNERILFMRALSRVISPTHSDAVECAYLAKMFDEKTCP
jgi:hypothetical protein